MTITNQEYNNFVASVTSAYSTVYETFSNRLNELDEIGVDVPRLLTASIAIGSEAGEFADLVKKVIFQNKDYTKEVQDKLQRELGDICFYLTLACQALGVTLDEVLQTNYEKLSKRYPNGVFETQYSENRKPTDI